MIERYTNPEMGRIWTLQHEFEVMLEVEITACEAMAELGQIPVEAAKNIREKAQFNLERVKEIEKVTNHDIIAFLTNVAEYVGEDSKYIHKGLTSSDVKLYVDLIPVRLRQVKVCGTSNAQEQWEQIPNVGLFSCCASAQ